MSSTVSPTHASSIGINSIGSPDNGRTCCPQYTIRLNVEAFKPSKKHRQVINRFNRYLSQGLKPGEEDEANSGDVDMVSGEAGGSGSSPARSRPSPNPKSTGKGRAKDKGKGRAAEYDFVSELRGYEHGFGQEGVHRFEVSRVHVMLNASPLTVLRLNSSLRKRHPRHLSCTRSIRSQCTRTDRKR